MAMRPETTHGSGLTAGQAAERLAKAGPNAVARPRSLPLWLPTGSRLNARLIAPNRSAPRHDGPDSRHER